MANIEGTTALLKKPRFWPHWNYLLRVLKGVFLGLKRRENLPIILCIIKANLILCSTINSHIIDIYWDRLMITYLLLVPPAFSADYGYWVLPISRANSLSFWLIQKVCLKVYCQAKAYFFWSVSAVYLYCFYSFGLVLLWPAHKCLYTFNLNGKRAVVGGKATQIRSIDGRRRL